MMRLSSLDSHGGLISICPSTSTDEQSPRGYGTEYQTMVEGYDEDATIVNEYTGNGHVGYEEDATMGNGHVGLSEKKRRLNVEQVKALEKNFELENKLEPERKVKLAQELGLQPRQVAVWFQNRRARWKTKQIEKDYSILKDQYDTLRLSFDSLRRDNDALLREIAKLKAKLIGEEENNSTESDISIKEEEISLLDHKTLEREPSSPPPLLEYSRYLNYRSFTDIRDLLPNAAPSSSSAAAGVAEAGSSDSSDSSVVVNDESSSTEREAPGTFSGCNFHYVKMEQTEEHNDFLSEEEACGFFSDEQPPSLHWYSTADHWT